MFLLKLVPGISVDVCKTSLVMPWHETDSYYYSADSKCIKLTDMSVAWSGWSFDS